MNNPIDKMTAHFRTKISGDMHSVLVPEWETTIWYKPSNTLAEEGNLIKLHQDGKTVEALVETLITKARNADGTKMFKKVDKVTMMNEVDPAVLIRVVGEMNAANADSNIEFAEKN
jgi:hypothetical protein